MKIIEQSHEILDYDGLDLIERAGRTCYKSEDKIGCVLRDGLDCVYEHPDFYEDELIGPVQNADGTCAQDDCPHHSAVRFTSQLIKRGHEAMLEHGVTTVKFTTNRGVTHELVRHRVASFGQESTRYVKYDNVEFVRPVWWAKKPLGQKVWTAAMKVTEWAYRALLKIGWLPEEARDVLPNALKTEIVVTANYREWRHILKLRAIGTTGKPHPQMRALMLPLLAEFKEKLPAVFEDLDV